MGEELALLVFVFTYYVYLCLCLFKGRITLKGENENKVVMGTFLKHPDSRFTLQNEEIF